LKTKTVGSLLAKFVEPRRPAPPYPRGKLAVSCKCRQCGRPIAMQLIIEALCCACRYRPPSIEDFEPHEPETQV
jgi:hypothetical protein